VEEEADADDVDVDVDFAVVDVDVDDDDDVVEVVDDFVDNDSNKAAAVECESSRGGGCGE
jgi:hypothetical protein